MTSLMILKKDIIQFMALPDLPVHMQDCPSIHPKGWQQKSFCFLKNIFFMYCFGDKNVQQ